MSALPKPILRGYTRRYGVKIVVGAVVFGVVGAAAFHFLYAVPKQKKIKAFFETYDAMQHYKELSRFQYLQSPKAGD